MTTLPKRIVISGYYGYDNTGDEAILAAMIDQFRRHLPAVEFVVLSFNPERTTELHGVRAIHPQQYYEVAKEIAASHLVLTGGGGLLHDYGQPIAASLFDTPLSDIPYFSLPLLLARLSGVPSMFYAVGVGPITTDDAARILRFVGRNIDVIAVRDEESKTMLERLGGIETPITVTADATLGLVPASAAEVKPLLTETLGDLPRPFFGVSVRHWSSAGKNFEAAMADGLDQLLDTVGGSVVFIPFQTHGGPDVTGSLEDESISRRIRDAMHRRKRATILPGSHHPKVIAGIFQELDLIIGMRLHSLILGANAHRPLVAINYDPKVGQFMKRLGLSAFTLDVNEVSAESLLQTAAAAYTDRQMQQKKIAERVASLTRAAEMNVTQAIALLRRSADRPLPSPASLHRLADHHSHYEKLVKEHLAREYAKREFEAQQWQTGIAHTAAIESMKHQYDVISQALSQEQERLMQTADQLARRSRDLTERSQELTERSGQLAAKTTEFEASQMELSKKYQELQTIFGSWRWKVTAPFQRVGWTILHPVVFLKKHLVRRLPVSTQQTVFRAVQRLRWTLTHPRRTVKKHLIYRLPFAWQRRIFRLHRQLTGRVRVDTATTAPSVPSQSLTSFGRYTLLYFPIIDWQLRFQRPQQLASQFARAGHRIFYFNTTIYPFKREPVSDDELSAMVTTEQLSANVWLVQLCSFNLLSIYRDSLTDPRDIALLQRSIDVVKKRFDLQRTISLVDLPFWQPLASRLKKNHVVYDCMDDHDGFSTNTPQMTGQEAKLLKEADIVVTSSDRLYAKAKKQNDQTVLVKNATDFDHFAKAAPHRRFRSLSGPVIGYYGAISDWFDIELIESVAKARPKWNIVLVGSTFGAEAIEKLPGKYPNVHLMGERPYSEIPSWLHGFDVCLIPFKLNNLTRATNPVKFYEYLSAGKPVVSVDLPELHSYEGYYYYRSENAAAFLKNIELALAEDNAERRAKRIALARQNTWADRFRTLSEALRRYLDPVSVVVVTYDNLKYTKVCLESLLTRSHYPNMEIIVVDNNSADGTPDYLKTLARSSPMIQVILNKDNRGFAAANNQGIKRARGQYIILLNNDTVVTDHWIEGLVTVLGDATVGAVGPVTNSCGNEQKIPVTYSTLDAMQTFASGYTRTHQTTVELNTLGFYCVAIRKDVFDAIGLLDESFGMGMFEDDDFCYRLKRRQYRIIATHGVFVHHFGNASFNMLPTNIYTEIWETNKDYLEKKWKITWKPPALVVDDREEVQRILQQATDVRGIVILSPTIDWNYVFQRPQQLATAFAKNNFLVFYCTRNHNRDAVSGLQKVNDRLYLCNVWHLLTTVPNSIVLAMWPHNKFFVDLFAHTSKKVIYDYMDEIDIYEVNNSEVRSDHTALLTQADLVTVTALSLYEEVIAQGIDPRKVLYSPNGVDIECFQPSAPANPPADLQFLVKTKRPIIGYYGALAQWIDYPLLQRLAIERPNYEIVLIGPDFDGSLKKSGLLSLSNVTYLGPKEYGQLPGYLASFDVAMLPFIINRITQSVSPIKIFEYMAGQRPVVTTALRECRNYSCLFVSDTPEAFVNNIDEALRAKNDLVHQILLRSTAQENTWVERVNVMVEALHGRFDPRPNQGVTTPALDPHISASAGQPTRPGQPGPGRVTSRSSAASVSLVLPSFNALAYLQQTVQSLQQYTDPRSLELIIVDNHSDQDTRQYLAELASQEKNIRLIQNETNRGFAAACNQGITAATGHYIGLVNNDIIVTPDWLPNLLKYFSLPNIGGVGPVTNAIGNEARLATIGYRDRAGINPFAKAYGKQNAGQYFDIPVLAMFCVIFSRQAIEAVGLLDEAYERGFFEDDDYSVRLHQAGWRTICAEDVFVHHFGSMSFGTVAADERRRLLDKNRQRFETKFHRPWQPHLNRNQAGLTMHTLVATDDAVHVTARMTP